VILEAPADVIEESRLAAIDGGPARWNWYLFALDREGVGTLLYPRAANQPNQVNLLSSDASSRTRIVAPGPNGWLFSPAASNPDADEDFATLFLLASATPLPDPAAVLNFTGVGSRAAADAAPDVVETGSLSRVLFDLGGGSRAGNLTAPVQWSLQRVPLPSRGGD